MQLSVIIPTLNEEECIGKLLKHLKMSLKGVHYEIIVADAGSADTTRKIAEEEKVTVLNCRKMSRAYQMNEGAAIAKSDVLYFVHADSYPPKSFYEDIVEAIKEGYDLGCYRFKFDSDRFLLAVNSYFTRFDRKMCRGGDQTLFIKKTVFEKLKGYRNDYRIMEEYEFIDRAREEFQFKIIPKDVIVSPRKYDHNSYFRVNIANLVVFTMYRMGSSQEKMVKAYGRLLNHPKAESLT